MWYRKNETDNEKQPQHWFVNINRGGKKSEFAGKLP